ncbi:MAG: DUF4874 domain-containing protein [Kiritimatiellae bacterium]|nr:DUF4874 domain-containing protein [Kiritimatiellia bacterium]
MKLTIPLVVLCFAAAAAFGAAPFEDACSPLESNPARGAAGGGWHVLKEDGNKPGDPKGFCSWLWDIGHFSAGNEYKGKLPPPERIGGRDIPLTDDALDSIRQTFANARANGAMMIVRFGYTWSDACGCEPSNFDTLLAHIAQIGGVMKDYGDVVLAVECGMCGPWAEMHSSNYLAPEHKVKLIDAWMAALPKNVALLVRSPSCVVEYSGKDSETFMKLVRSGKYYEKQPAQRRIGMYNDGYLGTEWDYGTWPGGKNSFTRAQGVEYLEARRNVPYGGELAYIGDGEAHKVKLFDTKEYNIVEEWYRTHLSYLRNINGKSESLPRRIGELSFSHEYDFAGMPDLHEWYGKDLRFFMREHMGYRFVIRGAKVMRDKIEVSIENTGFGHLLLKSAGELVVGKKSIPAKLDLRTLKPGETRAFTIPIPKSAQEIAPKVALRLKLATPAEQEIKFANDALWDDSLAAFALPSKGERK